MSGVEAVAARMGADWPFRCTWVTEGLWEPCPRPAGWAAEGAASCGCPVGSAPICDGHREVIHVGHFDTGQCATCGQSIAIKITAIRPLNEGDLPGPEEGL